MANRTSLSPFFMDIQLLSEKIYEEMNESHEVVKTLYEFEKNSNFTTELKSEVSIPSSLLKLGEDIAKEKIKNGMRCFNAPNLSLTRIEIPKNKIPHFIFGISDYYATLGTHYALDKVLNGKTIRKTYGDIDEMSTIIGFNRSSYAKTVGTSTLVLTKDNKALFTQRSNKVAVEPGSVHVTIAEGSQHTDIDSRNRLNPVITFMRGVKEELQTGNNQIAIDSGNITILGIGISRKYLQPEFCLLAEVPQTAQEILKRIDTNAEDAWERQRMFAIDFTAESMLALLKKYRFSPHGLMAMQMALKYKKLIY